MIQLWYFNKHENENPIATEIVKQSSKIIYILINLIKVNILHD